MIKSAVSLPPPPPFPRGSHLPHPFTYFWSYMAGKLTPFFISQWCCKAYGYTSRRNAELGSAIIRHGPIFPAKPRSRPHNPSLYTLWHSPKSNFYTNSFEFSQCNDINRTAADISLCDIPLKWSVVRQLKPPETETTNRPFKPCQTTGLARITGVS